MKSKLADLEAEKAVLQARATEGRASNTSAITLSPWQLAGLFAAQVAQLRHALNTPEIGTKATSVLQRLNGRVVIRLGGGAGPEGGDHLEG